MGSDSNRLRKKWQDYSGENASNAENNFFETFKILFEDTEYQIKAKPKEFNKIYVDYPLKEKDLSEIYTPDKQITKHGIVPWSFPNF
ncbi:MAG: MunI family type II restriction endonuclease [Ignavibacteria bacterium]|nr:MunI family type II restriction endonuclease [Ignavibacteria bacterium]